MKNEILTMVEFHKRKNEDYPGYEYPTVPGTFLGKLSVLHWATHSIIHSLWILADGRKVDCALFKDNDYCGIEEISIGDNAELFFQIANSGKVYLRGIKPIANQWLEEGNVETFDQGVSFAKRQLLELINTLDDSQVKMVSSFVRFLKEEKVREQESNEDVG